MGGTHFLNSADQWKGQNMERNRASERHSLSGECRLIDNSGQEKSLRVQCALTNWRVQIHGQLKTWKETCKAMGTYKLKSENPWTTQDTEEKETGCIRGTYFLKSADQWTSQDSEHGKGPSEQGELTL